MKLGFAVASVALLVSVFGCGQGSVPADIPSAVPEVPTTDQLKSRLESVAESGTAGSALAGMPEAIAQVSDPAKRDALMADYQKLEGATAPNTIKQIAKSMLEKL